MRRPAVRAALRPWLLAAGLATATLAAATGSLDRWLDRAGLERVNQANDLYLQRSFDAAMNGFLVLSGIKTGLAIVEGSTVGVGFNLQVGDVVQAVYDYVDVAWKAALAGASVLLLMRMALDALRSVDHWVLCAALALALACVPLAGLRQRGAMAARMLREVATATFCVALSLYLLLPLAVAGAASLSSRITAPLVTEAHRGFAAARADATPEALYQRMFPDSERAGSLLTRLDVPAQVESGRRAMLRLSTWVDATSRDFARWTAQLIAGYLFDCLIFPLAFFAFLYGMTRALLRHTLGAARRADLPADLERMLDRYFKRRPPDVV